MVLHHILNMVATICNCKHAYRESVNGVVMLVNAFMLDRDGQRRTATFAARAFAEPCQNLIGRLA